MRQADKDRERQSNNHGMWQCNERGVGRRGDTERDGQTKTERETV